MRTAMLACVIAIAAVAGTSVAEARPRPSRQKRFESNKTIGLGLELGAPFGLAGKYFLQEGGDRAFQFGVGEIDHYVGDRSGFHIYGDYLFHPLSILSADAFEVPFFVGVGGRYWDFDYAHDSGYALGIRVPFGLALDFNNVPVDVFLQLVPVLDFVHGYENHDLYGDFDVSVGARFWFD